MVVTQGGVLDNIGRESLELDVIRQFPFRVDNVGAQPRFAARAGHGDSLKGLRRVAEPLARLAKGIDDVRVDVFERAPIAVRFVFFVGRVDVDIENRAQRVLSADLLVEDIALNDRQSRPQLSGRDPWRLYSLPSSRTSK